MRSRLTADATTAPDPAATISCCGPGRRGLPRRVDAGDARCGPARRSAGSRRRRSRGRARPRTTSDGVQTGRTKPPARAITVPSASRTPVMTPFSPTTSSIGRRSTRTPRRASVRSSSAPTGATPFVKTMRSSVHWVSSSARSARSSGLADQGERRIRLLEAVALDAAVQLGAVVGADARDRRQGLAHAGGDHQRLGQHVEVGAPRTPDARTRKPAPSTSPLCTCAKATSPLS